MLSPGSKNSSSRGTIEENIRVKKGLNHLKIRCCISCQKNKRILNLHEKRFYELENFQANTIVFQINTNASSRNLETQVGQLALEFQNPNLTMSESSHLVLNLNEMMEAYTKVEEETVQETQSGEMQAKERAKDREEIGPRDEESRKMKRGAEAEQRNEKVRSLISDKATSLMEKRLGDRGFIVERGFRKLVSPFSEMFEKRGWQSLGKHKEPGCAALVKEFFANMVEEEGKKIYVIGQWIDFSKKMIIILFNLKV